MKVAVSLVLALVALAAFADTADAHGPYVASGARFQRSFARPVFFGGGYGRSFAPAYSYGYYPQVVQPAPVVAFPVPAAPVYQQELVPAAPVYAPSIQLAPAFSYGHQFAPAYGYSHGVQRGFFLRGNVYRR